MDLLDELRDLITRHTGRGTLRKRRVTQDASVTFAGERTEPMAVMSEPSLAVVAQGVKRTVLNGTAYDYRAGQYVVVPVDLPVIGQAPAARPEDPLVVFSLTLSPALIAALLLEAPAAAPAPAFGGLVVGDAPTELLDPVVRLLRVAAHPDDLRVLGPAWSAKSTGVCSRARSRAWSAASGWPTVASRTSPGLSAGCASTTPHRCAWRTWPAGRG